MACAIRCLQVIDAQCSYGLDIITDGEVNRDVYIFYFLRHLDGLDFANPVHVVYRNGACQARLPAIRGSVNRSSLPASMLT